MKTTHLYILNLIFLLAFASCTKEELQPSVQNEFIFLQSEQTELFFERGSPGEAIDLSVLAVLHAADRADDVSYTFEVLSSSTAVEGVHYSISSNQGTIQANAIKDTLPIVVYPSKLVPCEAVILDLALVSSDIEMTNLGSISLSLNLASGSQLAGIVDYMHTDNFSGEDINGTVEISNTANEGEYIITDFSFGAWGTAYGIDPPTGTIRWFNNCSSIRMSGTDNYGDVWEMSEILESGGQIFSFRWSNTYGEFGTVSLSRQDGASWPTLELE